MPGDQRSGHVSSIQKVGRDPRSACEQRPFANSMTNQHVEDPQLNNDFAADLEHLVEQGAADVNNQDFMLPGNRVRSDFGELVTDVESPEIMPARRRLLSHTPQITRDDYEDRPPKRRASRAAEKLMVEWASQSSSDESIPDTMRGTTETRRRLLLEIKDETPSQGINPESKHTRFDNKSAKSLAKPISKSAKSVDSIAAEISRKLGDLNAQKILEEVVETRLMEEMGNIDVELDEIRERKRIQQVLIKDQKKIVANIKKKISSLESLQGSLEDNASLLQ